MTLGGQSLMAADFHRDQRWRLLLRPGVGQRCFVMAVSVRRERLPYEGVVTQYL